MVVVLMMLGIMTSYSRASKVAHMDLPIFSDNHYGLQGRAVCAICGVLTCAGIARAPLFLPACLVPVLQRVLVCIGAYETANKIPFRFCAS